MVVLQILKCIFIYFYRQRQNLRNSVSGKFPLEPDILKYEDLTLCSLSNPELFYIENPNINKLSSSRKSTKR